MKTKIGFAVCFSGTKREVKKANEGGHKRENKREGKVPLNKAMVINRTSGRAMRAIILVNSTGHSPENPFPAMENLNLTATSDRREPNEETKGSRIRSRRVLSKRTKTTRNQKLLRETKQTNGFASEKQSQPL